MKRRFIITVPNPGTVDELLREIGESYKRCMEVWKFKGKTVLELIVEHKDALTIGSTLILMDLTFAYGSTDAKSHGLNKVMGTRIG